MDSSIKSKCKKAFAAAIDFGTTYSGYAFSLTQDWKKLFTHTWQGGGLVSLKTPTVLLLDSRENFVAFGYDAEDQFSALTAKGQHKDHFFFRRFKMILYEDIDVNMKIKCQDEMEHTLPALTVFTHCIHYLKDHLYQEILKSVPDIQEEDISYVLTVPAIWGDKAKRFMREAAIQAGINKNFLIVALEPEAASIFCQHIPSETQDMSTTLGVVEPGTKYMVADLGGGTADITVHRKCADQTLEEIHPASGGPWGGKSVEDKFIKVLTDLSGEDTFEEFKRRYMEDYFEILRTFEVTKRSVTPEKKTSTLVRIPLSYVELCKNNKNVENFSDVINRSIHKGTVTYVNGKLKWSSEYFKEFFKSTIDSIIDHMNTLFREENVGDVGTVLLVGGFSECKLLQKAIRDKFTTKKIIVPAEAGLAVVKGAVYFGHAPDAISRRLARYTYGIQTWPEFDPSFHKHNKKITMDGRNRCRDIFFAFVRKGDSITPGFKKSQVFHPLNKKDRTLDCTVYISDDKNPQYVDDVSCRTLGTLRVPLPLTADINVEIEESLIFGETELKVEARDVYFGEKKEIVFELL